jgi:hypothetical protein
MSKLNKTMQEPEQHPAVFNLAPLTDDLSSSYLIEINQGGETEYYGVSGIEEAMQTILEHPFSTATINIGDKVPSIKFN